MTTKTPSRLAREIVEMAEAQRRLGIMDVPTFQKITVRHLGPDALKPVIARRAASWRSRRS